MRKLLSAAAVALVLTGSSFLHADSIQTLGPFTGTYNRNPPYPAPFTIGTFIINAGDTSATIRGTFGNLMGGSPHSAGTNLYFGSLVVATCVPFTPCVFGDNATPFSDTLNAAQLALLGVGPVNLTAQQISGDVVQLGTITFTQITGPSPVPEPSSILLCWSGLLGLAGIAKHKLSRHQLWSISHLFVRHTLGPVLRRLLRLTA